MTADDALRAFYDGSIYRSNPDDLRKMLKAVADAPATNPNYAHRTTQCAELIRHLLGAHEQGVALGESRQQHTLSHRLGKRTLVWTIVGAIAATIAHLQLSLRYFVSGRGETISKHGLENQQSTQIAR
jgi:hypothetical protein